MDETQGDIRGFLELLRRQVRLIVLAFFVVFGLALIAVLTLTPRYSSSALVLVDPREKDLLATQPDAATPFSDNARVDSEVEIIRSRSVLLDVVAAHDLTQDAEFSGTGDFSDRLLGWLGGWEPKHTSDETRLARSVSLLEDRLHVRRRSLTYLIEIAVTSADADKAARLANGVAQAYIERQVQAKVDAIAVARGVLDGRLNEARAVVTQSQNALAMFVAGNMDNTSSSDLLAVEAQGAPAQWDTIGEAVPVDVLTQYWGLQQSAALARSQYQTLLSRSSELAMQSDLQLADSRVVSEAVPADTPSFPNRRLMLVLAGIAGMGLGVGLALLNENYIGGIVSEAQARSVLKTPVLAQVPRRKPLGGDEVDGVADTIIAAPLSPFSEAIRRMRSGIDLRMRKMGKGGGATTGSVIMVSSALAGEGKTTIALALARTYALSGQKTILIDCDLRAPQVHRHLGAAPNHGLLDYLKGTAKGEALSEVIVRDIESGLSVVTGAHRSDTPTDQLLMGRAFAHLLQAARQNFDVVVLDKPPVLPVVDATHLAGFADIVALVIRWAGTGQAEVKAAIERIRDSQDQHAELAVVLDQQEGSSGDYRKAVAKYYQEG